MNVVKWLFGNQLLDCYVEHNIEYVKMNAIDAAELSIKKNEIKSSTMENFRGLLFLRDSDHERYGWLSVEW